MRNGKITSSYQRNNTRSSFRRPKRIFEKKNLWIIITVAIIAVVVFYVVLKQRKEKIEPSTVEIVRNQDFFERSGEFSKTLLSATIFSGEGNVEMAGEELKKLSSQWLLIVSDFQDKKPVQCRKEKDWSGSFGRIEQKLKLAESLSMSGRSSESYLVLQEVGNSVKSLQENCEVRVTEIKLLEFYFQMKKTLATEDRSEAISSLPELKMLFTELRETKMDNLKYQNNLFRVGAGISRIENSTPKVFNEFKQDLKPAFLQLIKELQ